MIKKSEYATKYVFRERGVTKIIITIVALVSIMTKMVADGIEIGHQQTDVVVRRNIHDHDHGRTPCLGPVHDHGKKMELNGNLECEMPCESQENRR